QQLVSGLSFSILGVFILAANLAELTRPVCQHQGAAFISEVRQTAAVRAVKASAQKPTSSKLIIRGCIESEGALFGPKLMALAPYELAARDKGMVNGAP